MPKDRIAIVGAGISGLICAATLIDHGLDVSVYDKGFRPGGRLATRRTEVGEYDHGAQYLTVRDPRFERRVESWIEDGLVAEWKGRFISVKDGARRAVSEKTRRYVGVPEMNSVAAHLAADCQVRTRLQVSAITQQGREWALRHEHGEDGPFDFMILAVPAPQAVPLLAAPHPECRAKSPKYA